MVYEPDYKSRSTTSDQDHWNGNTHESWERNSDSIDGDYFSQQQTIEIDFFDGTIGDGNTTRVASQKTVSLNYQPLPGGIHLQMAVIMRNLNFYVSQGQLPPSWTFGKQVTQQTKEKRQRIALQEKSLLEEQKECSKKQIKILAIFQKYQVPSKKRLQLLKAIA